MRVAIIYLPYHAVENQPNIKSVAKNYGVFPPLTLLQVASVVMKYNHRVLFIDAIAEQLSFNDIIEKLKKFNPDLVMYTITTYLFHQTRKWIKAIKEKINVPTVVGGAHLFLYPKETLHYPEIDFGLIGEAELTIKEFLEAIGNSLISEKNQKNNKRRLNLDKINSKLLKIQGICFRYKGKIIVNYPKEKLKNLDTAPYPARFLIDNTKYYSIISQKRNYSSIITMRGCPYHCIFCEQKSKYSRMRSPENVVDEIISSYYNYGIREFEFFDPTFTLNKNRTIEICKGIVNSKIKIIYSIRTRADLIDDEIAEWLKKSGCIRVYLGIESSNQKILDFIRKDITPKRIKRTVNILRKHKIKVFGYFMFGLPFDTPKTIKNTINFAKSLKLDFVQFSELSILPNTELYDDYLRKVINYDYWREFILDESKRTILPKYKCKLTSQEIERIIRKAYLNYYLDPRNLIRSLIAIRSLEQLKKYSKAVLSMIFTPPDKH